MELLDLLRGFLANEPGGSLGGGYFKITGEVVKRSDKVTFDLLGPIHSRRIDVKALSTRICLLQQTDYCCCVQHSSKSSSQKCPDG